MVEAVMAGPADWGAVAAPEPEEGPAAWGAQPLEPMSAINAAHMAGAPSYQDVRDHLEPIAEAFGQGFREGWGPQRWGLSEENTKWLTDKGLFAKGEKYDNPLQAFNELFYEGLARTGELFTRGVPAIYRGVQAAGFEAGLPADIVSLPEAFLGSPHPTGIPLPGRIPRPLTELVPRELEPGVTAPPEPAISSVLAKPAPDLVQARELGVIGPERPPITEGTPKEAVTRTAAAERMGDDVLRGPPPEPNPWRERFEQFVSKIEKPEDVQRLIIEAADQNADFLRARSGDLPLADTRDIAAAAGFEPGEINRRGIGRDLKNDSEVRTAMQFMLQVTENVKSAARDLRTADTPENLIALQQAIMRRDLAVEQVVGLRAEWGRTGNVFQEFLRDVKDQEGLSNFLKDKGRTPEDLRGIAQGLDALDGAQAARFLNDARSPTFWDKAIWYWVNALISGPVTHAKYVIANAAFGAYEAAVVTPMAAAIGMVRQVLTPAAREQGYVVAFRKPNGEILLGRKGEAHLDLAERHGFDVTKGEGAQLDDGFADRNGKFLSRQQMMERNLPETGEELRERIDRVYLGEAPARLWGLIAGTPDAAVGAWKAARTGLQTPLPSEVAQNIVPRQNRNISFQQKPIDGAIGTAIGLPSRGASAIHSFFNFLGHRAEIEAQAYRMAAKEGLKPTEEGFWQRRQELADNPTKEMMDHAIENGYKLTFITELGPSAKAFQQWVNKFPPARLVMPFVHIPANILKAAYENTPAAFLDPAMRADLTGKNGAAKQDTAVARIVVGSAVGAWMVNQVMNDRATGYGPTDPKERAQWLATGHQPYSVRIGDYWVSYNRFGPLGTLFGLHANMAEVLPHLKWDSEEVTKAAGTLVKSTGRLIEDEVGMQGLANLIEAVNDPDRKGARFTSSFVGSWLPYSSLLRQTASFMDPQMREAKTVIDGLRYQIPVMRQNLLPKRDWTGEPLANTGYETLIRMGRVSTDPVALEMRTLDLHPAPPQNRIGGIKLTPELYDRYQSVAGPLTKSMLDMLVSQPGWYELPPYVREETFKAAIRSTRQSAAAMIQAENPRIIQQALDDMTARINGGKATKKLKD